MVAKKDNKWDFVEKCVVASFASGKGGKSKQHILAAIMAWNAITAEKDTESNIAKLVDTIDTLDSTDNTETDGYNDGEADYVVKK